MSAKARVHYAKPRRRVRPSRAAESPPSAWACYVESSALVAAVIERHQRARAVLESGTRFLTSALTVAEVHRAIVRARVAGRLASPGEGQALRQVEGFFAQASVVPVSDAVIARAGRPFPVEPVRTLDAMHLATIELIGDRQLAVLTLDSRIRANVIALGFVLA